VPPGDYTVRAARKDELGSVQVPEVAVHSGNRKVELVIPDAATLAGRVVMNGKPVDYFGVAITTDDRGGSPDPVRARDGRFEEVGLRPGTVAVTIVGPSFRSRRLENVVVHAGEHVELGQLVVEQGKHVSGRVVDGSGRPVANATVIVESGDTVDNDASLRTELDAPRGVHTDARGHFVLAGLVDGDLYIQASEPVRGLALPRKLTAADLARGVTIVLVPSGALTGTGPASKTFAVVTSLADGHRYDALISDGAFSVDQLPAGDYIVVADESIMPATLVHVDGGQTAHVAIPEPTGGVELDVAVIGDCGTVSITSPELPDPTDSLGLASESCFAASDAVFVDVSPGRYRVCQDQSCTMVDVHASPARQTVTLTAAPSAPDPDEDPE
jgi:hypothetical protein